MTYKKEGFRLGWQKGEETICKWGEEGEDDDKEDFTNNKKTPVREFFYWKDGSIWMTTRRFLIRFCGIGSPNGSRLGYLGETS